MHPLLAFLFASPWLAVLAAAGAVAVPVVIHLLNRKRFRVVTWAAMRFLLAAQKQSVRRMKLEQILLLAVRCALLLLLVLAMASVTPWAEAMWYKMFPDSAVLAAAGNQRTHKIIVLDGSFSMALKTEDGDCFARGKKRAAQILDNSLGGDSFSVVLMAAPPQRIVPEPSDDATKVAAEIDKLRLPHGNADLTTTLLTIEEMVRRSPPKYEAREVYFLTDMQRSTWKEQNVAKVAEKVRQLQSDKPVRLIFVDVGRVEDGSDPAHPRDPENLAVTSLTVGAPLAIAGVETPLRATLYNYGREELKKVKVELLVGRARATAQDPPFEMQVVTPPRMESVSVPAGQSMPVTIPYTFPRPGDYAVQVRVTHDRLEVDDSRSLVVTVKETVPVLLVNGKPATRIYDQATSFLYDALNPYGKEQPPRDAPLRPKVISESEFGDANLGDLAPYDCVFLCDVPALRKAEVARLETHLRRGGGVVFCLGSRVDLEAYNRLVYLKGEGLLPGPLIGVEHAQEGGPSWAFDLEGADLKKPPLEPFLGEAERGSLSRARFRDYVQIQLPTQGRARRLLSYVPEPEKAGEVSIKERDARAKMRVRDPAIVEWTRYRGKVVVLTSSANMDWTTWPGSPSYLVFMQELVRHAVAGRLHDQAVLVGEPLEEVLPAALGGKEAIFKTPDGSKITATAQARDDAAVLRFTDTDQSGLYVATVADEPREHLFAVNPPTATEAQQASESNLARVAEPELRDAYPGWKFQIVTDPASVPRAAAATLTGEGPPILHGMGSIIARWLLIVLFMLLMIESLLAWKLGHHTSVPSNERTRSGRLLPISVALVAGLAFLMLTGVLLHTAWTDDFLGFLPDRFRAWSESFLGVPQLVSGESSHWRLEYKPYLTGGHYEPWLVGLVAVSAIAYVVGIYLAEGRTAGRSYRLLLAGLRALLVLVVLVVLLPQLQLWFERQGWPDVALIIDDSGSMSTADQYRDPRVKEAADQLAKVADLPTADRLRLAQALLTHPDRDWLKKLVLERKVKVHVYHCSGRAGRLADITEASDIDSAMKEVRALPPEGKYGETSQLGKSVRDVLAEYRGSSLSAIIMLTDGVTTEGEDLVHASRHASKAGVPLFFVGMGDSQEARDLILHDLQVEDSVFVGDRLVFEARFTAQGYTNLPPVTVELCEKGSDGKDEPVAPSRPEDPPTRVKVTPDPQGKPVKFRVVYRPASKGEKTYVLRLAKESEPNDEVDRTNNRVERRVKVEEARPSRVLYIEGYPRPEFRALKPMLEREAGDPAKKSIELKVLLLDAQDDWHLQDKSARPDFPTKEELNQYDLVILGDVDPKHAKIGEKNLKLLVDFVRERGGGLLMIAGKRDNPRSYRDTPLADVMPIRLTNAAALDDPDAPRREGFRPQLTALGRSHPMFRLRPDEAANNALWEKMPEIYWFADGYALQPAAEVLAVHPKQRAVEPRPGSGDEHHPLAAQHFVGNGRCLFLGFDESWAWAFRDSIVDYNRFWVQTVHYLARSRLGRIDLRLDRTTPYRRGEPIKVTVRFPDDQQPPKEGTKVQVLVQRRAMDQPNGPVEEKWTLSLAKVEGSRGTFEALQTPTPAGHYTFTLALPAEASPPRAECRVLPPPDEKARVSMNQTDMERAAEETSGKFYTLADADKLFEDLPTGTRVTLRTPGPPWLLWNHFLAFFLVLGLLGGEWMLRKRKHLL